MHREYFRLQVVAALRKYFIFHFQRERERRGGRLLVSEKVKARRRTAASVYPPAISPSSSFFDLSPLFLFFFFFVSPTNLKASVCFIHLFVAAKRNGVAAIATAVGTGEDAYCFSRLYFYIAFPSLCALTSIACPFSIHVHYEITGSLYEIHLLLPSSRTAPPFDVPSFALRFPAPFKRVSLWK